MVKSPIFRKGFGKFRFALPVLAIFPFLVGFSPPDTSGTFISLSGGKGVYPSASCNQSFRNEYKEVALAVDHRVATIPPTEVPWSWLKPRYVTFGAFGELGANRKTVGSSHNFDSTTSEITTSEAIEVGGLHLALDWKWAGVDMGGMAINLPDLPDYDKSIMPRVGLRIGPPVFYVSSTIAAGLPLLSDGGLLNLGIGSSLGAAQFWAGHGEGTGDMDVEILRMGYNFNPVSLNLTMQGDLVGNFPQLSQLKSLKNDYGMALRLEFRLPGSF